MVRVLPPCMLLHAAQPRAEASPRVTRWPFFDDFRETFRGRDMASAGRSAAAVAEHDRIGARTTFCRFRKRPRAACRPPPVSLLLPFLLDRGFAALDIATFSLGLFLSSRQGAEATITFLVA